MIEMMIRDDVATGPHPARKPRSPRHRLWVGVAALFVTMLLTLPSSARAPSRSRAPAPGTRDASTPAARPASHTSLPPVRSTQQLIPHTHTIVRGDTLATVLSGFDVTGDEIARVVDSVTRYWDVRRAQIGSQLEVVVDPEKGQIQGLVVDTDDDRRVEVRREGDAFVSKIVAQVPESSVLQAALVPASTEEPTDRFVAQGAGPSPAAPVVALVHQSATIGRGQTLGKVLAGMGLDAGEVTRVNRAVAARWDTRHADPGTQIDALVEPSTHRVMSLSIQEGRRPRVDLALAAGAPASAVPAPAPAVGAATPVLASAAAPPQPGDLTVQLRPGESVASMLARLGFAKPDVPKATVALGRKLDPRRTPAGTEFSLALDARSRQAKTLTIRNPRASSTVDVALPAGIVVAGSAAPADAPPVVAVAVQPATAAPTPTPAVRTATLDRGETITGLLRELGIEGGDAVSVAAALRPRWNLRRAQIGTRVALTLDPATGRGTSIRVLAPRGGSAIDVDLGDALRSAPAAAASDVVRPPPASVTPATAVARGGDASPDGAATHVVAGRVQSSLYDAAVNAGLGPALIADLATMFAGEVDLRNDVHRGDSFRVLYEDPRGSGSRDRVLAAELVTGGETHRSYVVTTRDGRTEYYNDAARTSRKPFLRSPLDVTKVTSPFTMGRFHPILGYIRPHLGVDLEAATGTPIHAIGDGVVQVAGWHYGDGRFIKVEHDGTYSSSYSHLSAFAPGLREGKRVTKGQIIGYTGSTGMATGPHLHFAIWKNDHCIDPMGVRITGGRALAGDERREFEKLRAVRLAALESVDAPGASQVALVGH